MLHCLFLDEKLITSHTESDEYQEGDGDYQVKHDVHGSLPFCTSNRFLLVYDCLYERFQRKAPFMLNDRSTKGGTKLFCHAFVLVKLLGYFMRRLTCQMAYNHDGKQANCKTRHHLIQKVL